jgi:hypothetical protein
VILCNTFFVGNLLPLFFTAMTSCSSKSLSCLRMGRCVNVKRSAHALLRYARDSHVEITPESGSRRGILVSCE